MPELNSLLQQGSAYGWLFVPTAVLLGALHGLEPGHSKTMMAAFIVAIRGTVAQAVMLGLAATVSHTVVVWLIALIGLRLGQRWNTENVEPWFQTLAAALIIGIALWMILRTARWSRQHAPHDHDHDHDHDHHDHEDEHQREHAEQIRRHLHGQTASNRQILLFGLTGGLIPCPASITVLMLCLQLKQLALGAALVLCFSVGMALTLVLAGVIAAVGLRHASQRWEGFSMLAHRAPYVSGVLMLIVGGYMAWHGLSGLLDQQIG